MQSTHLEKEKNNLLKKFQTSHLYLRSKSMASIYADVRWNRFIGLTR